MSNKSLPRSIHTKLKNSLSLSIIKKCFYLIVYRVILFLVYICIYYFMNYKYNIYVNITFIYVLQIKKNSYYFYNL